MVSTFWQEIDNEVEIIKHDLTFEKSIPLQLIVYNLFPRLPNRLWYQKTPLTKNKFAIGYTTGDFTHHTNVNDGQVL